MTAGGRLATPYRRTARWSGSTLALLASPAQRGRSADKGQVHADDDWGEAVRPMITKLTAIVAVLLLAMPLGAQAQQSGKLYRIGMLETIAASLNSENLQAFRDELTVLGYAEGQNLKIEYRSVDGRAERFPELAAELARLPVDLIVTRGTPAALAAKRATRTIPIVMAASGDPVRTGLVQGLARPGGNLTGLTSLTPEMAGKRLA
jgi:ABC-type uncharacterized transport system substrate-binding protein